MRTLNPAMKFVTLLCVTFVLAFRYNPVLNLAVFVLCMAALLVSKVRLKTGTSDAAILLAATGMFFTGYRFSADASMPVAAADFLVSDSRVWNGVAQASRVLAYAGVGFLFTLTTDRILMVKSFESSFICHRSGPTAFWQPGAYFHRRYRNISGPGRRFGRGD